MVVVGSESGRLAVDSGGGEGCTAGKLVCVGEGLVEDWRGGNMRSGRPKRPTKADSQTWLVFTPFFPFTLPSLMLSVSLSLISLILHPRSGSCLCARTAAAVQGIGLVGAGGGLGITLARRCGQ